MSIDPAKLVDLTYPFGPDTIYWPTAQPFKLQRVAFGRTQGGYFYYSNNYGASEHGGTHMDAPMHFISGGTSADRLPVDRFFAPLCVISIAARAARDADTTLTVDDILAWEKAHGRVPAGAFVAMHTGWDARVPNPASFINTDAAGKNHAPGLGVDAATYLVKQRDIVGVGTDTLSLDMTAAGGGAAHVAFLGAGKYGIELMANLTQVPPSGATVIVGGPKHEGASGGPTRVYAVV
jgi:kynurenine formamidase